MNAQKAEIANQSSQITEQLNLYREKKAGNIELIKKYYKEYAALLEEQDRLERQTPINFLTDGKIIKGYNGEGDLVAIYDMYENYAVVEYESYYTETVEKTRIARVYDNNGKQVLFNYNEMNELTSITDTRGRNTRFSYNATNQLVSITWDTGEELEFSYVTDKILSLEEKKNGLKTSISYLNNRVSRFSHELLKKKIANGKCEGFSRSLSQMSFLYNLTSEGEISHVLIEENPIKEDYYFNTQGACTEYTLREDGVYTKAEKYEYTPYWIGNEKQTNPKYESKRVKKEYLYGSTIAYDTDKIDVETTTLDQFNNPVQTTTSAVKVNDSGTNTQTMTVDYTYDDNQKLVEEKTTVIYTNPAKTVTSYKKYHYNAYGDIIRTESYVEGEEYTKGKTIAETVYDKKGNVVKSFMYNTLDSSSKFYTETEYDETGKVLAEYDETGENKTC